MKDYAKINKKVSQMFAAPKSQQEKNASSISNLKTRLEAGGVDVSKETDGRNAVEKFLGLPDDQNILFDIFELLGRPQQALFGGIKAAQEGKDFAEGAWEGFKGDEYTQAKEILKNMGMEDREGKLDLVDVLGFAGDVVVDPMTLIPVAGYSKFAKALKSGDSLKDAAKLLDTTSDLVGKATSKGIKAGVKGADELLETGLKAYDASKGITYANDANKYADLLGKTGDGTGLLESYKGMKNIIESKFGTKLSKNARYAQQINNANEAKAKTVLQGLNNALLQKVDDTAKKMGKTSDDVLKDVQLILDNTGDLTMKQVISEGVNGHIKYSKKLVDKLDNIAKDSPDLYENLMADITKDKNGILVLGDSWDKLVNNEIVNKNGVIKTVGKGLDTFDAEKLSEKVHRQNILGRNREKQIRELKDFYSKNYPELYKYLDGEDMIYNQMNRVLEEIFPNMEGLSEKYRNEFGYSKHALSKDYNVNVKKLKDFGVNDDVIEEFAIKEGQGGVIFSTPSKTLNSRKYNMSAAEANVLRQQEIINSIPNANKEVKKFVKENIQLFDDLATSGINDYILNMPTLAKKTAILDDVLIQQGFGMSGNITKIDGLEKQLKKAKELGDSVSIKNIQSEINKLWEETPLRVISRDSQMPRNFVRLSKDDKNHIVNYLKGIGNRTGSANIKEISRVLDNIEDLAIDPTVSNLLRLSTDTKSQNEFLKFYDKALDWFKGNKTASLTNQMNNIIGNTTNMWLAGVPMSDIVKYTSESFNDLRHWEDIFVRGMQDINSLTTKENAIFEDITDFMKYAGVLSDDEIAKVRDLDGVISKLHQANGSKLPLDKVRGAFARLNAAEDRIYKFALFRYAKDNPSFVKRLGIDIGDLDNYGRVSAKSAGEVIKKVLFDPYDLTAFEHGTMKRLVPFYTFAKKNLAFHLNNMGTNTRKYSNLFKAYNSAMESTLGDDYDNIADYLKENMYIPLPIKSKDGKYKFIRATIPFGDLTDIASDPLSGAINKLSPALKLPFELATNKNTFMGTELEKYPGEMSTQLPFMSKKYEHILSSLTGLDVPFKQGYRAYEGIKEGLPGQKLGGAISNLTTIEGDPAKDELYRQYEEIDQLETIMKQYKAKGYTFATMNELKRANKNNTIEGVQNRLNAILEKYK